MAVRGGNAVFFAPCGAPYANHRGGGIRLLIPLPKAWQERRKGLKGAGFDAAAEDKRGAGTCGARLQHGRRRRQLPGGVPDRTASLAITGDCTCQWCQYNPPPPRARAPGRLSSPRARWPRAWISGMKPVTQAGDREDHDPSEEARRGVDSAASGPKWRSRKASCMSSWWPKTIAGARARHAADEPDAETSVRGTRVSQRKVGHAPRRTAAQPRIGSGRVEMQPQDLAVGQQRVGVVLVVSRSRARFLRRGRLQRPRR